MSTDKKFYITTTLPYINSEPHIGFAKEIIKADVIARHKRQLGYEVFFNTGTDEHGLKIFQQAKESGREIMQHCDYYSEKFLELKEQLNLSFNNFIRTTDAKHLEAVKKFWETCFANGYIYKKNYQVKYCVGCELEKTDSELEDGRCPLHPNKDLEVLDEENYFFKFSAFGDKLLDFYEKNPDFVKPAHRLNEIKSFAKEGLRDFSISRVREKMPWGVDVPGDSSQVVYVWFDALINYISALGWPNDQTKFENFWPGLQVCGKDNLRQQSAMWPAMLMSVGLPISKNVLVFGFLTLNGQKISKSLGNTIDVSELIAKYPLDAIRYFLISGINTYEDSDFSLEKLNASYNADLVNGLGNLVARVSNLIEKGDLNISLPKVEFENEVPLISGEMLSDNLFKDFISHLEKFDLSPALELLANKVRESDEFLSKTTPWKMEDGSEKTEILQKMASNILNIAVLIYPFMPESAKKIITQFNAEKIKKGDILFPRIISTEKNN